MWRQRVGWEREWHVCSHAFHLLPCSLLLLQYNTWMGQYKEQIGQWEKKVEWEKGWYKHQARRLMLHQAFLQAVSRGGCLSMHVHLNVPPF